MIVYLFTFWIFCLLFLVLEIIRISVWFLSSFWLFPLQEKVICTLFDPFQVTSSREAFYGQTVREIFFSLQSWVEYLIAKKDQQDNNSPSKVLARILHFFHFLHLVLHLKVHAFFYGFVISIDRFFFCIKVCEPFCRSVALPHFQFLVVQPTGILWVAAV